MEAKELLIEKSNQVTTLNNVISEQQNVIENRQKQLIALEENYNIAQGRAALLASDLQDEKNKAERLKKGRNTWRTITTIGAGVIAGLFIILK